MPDFTIDTFHQLLSALKEQQYVFQTFAGFIDDPAPRVVILRHDVDRLPENSVVTAGIEKEMGITGTYYFRAGKQGFDNEAITKIARLCHEIGYHYEDLSLAAERQKIISPPDLQDLQDLQDVSRNLQCTENSN